MSDNCNFFEKILLKGSNIMTSVKDLLHKLNLIDLQNLEVFSTKTRDMENVKVMRDSNSGIIFLENFVPDDDVYEYGEYRNEGKKKYGERDYEIATDVRRRVKDYRQFYIGKSILDFGCGEGTFLREIKEFSQNLCGIEIEKSSIALLKEDGIACRTDLTELNAESVDTIFCFHTLEHLKEPIKILKKFKRVLKPGGHIVIEVPHANDFLLNYLQNKPFKDFTLWSQHLILHSRSSLTKFLKISGYNDFLIQGKQRYGVANHLSWLSYGKPGGHKSILSALNTPDLSRAYEASLQMIDANDTLVAIVSNE